MKALPLEVSPSWKLVGKHWDDTRMIHEGEREIGRRKHVRMYIVQMSEIRKENSRDRIIATCVQIVRSRICVYTHVSMKRVKSCVSRFSFETENQIYLLQNSNLISRKARQSTYQKYLCIIIFIDLYYILLLFIFYILSYIIFI